MYPEASDSQLASFPELNPNPVIELGFDGSLHYANPAARRLFGDLSQVGGEHPFFAGLLALVPQLVQAPDRSMLREVKVGDIYYEQALSCVSTDAIRIYALDITERKQAEEALLSALDDAQQHHKEITALLAATRAVLTHRRFEDAVRCIFDTCKELIGATAGYVAVLALDQPGGQERGHTAPQERGRATLQMLIRDAGGEACPVDLDLPMPIRGLRATVFSTGRAVYENSFPDSSYAALLPAGHVHLTNVLFAPLVIEGQTVGLLGLANKPGGFTPNDIHMAGAFGELVAIALVNGRSRDELERLVQMRSSELIEANLDLQAEIAERTQAKADLQRRNAELSALSHRLVVVQEKERRAIACELHDEVGGLLTSLKLILAVGCRSAAEGIAAQAQWERAEGLTNDLLAKVRRLSLDLRPGMLDDLGLLPTLFWHTRRYSEETGIHVALAHEGLDRRFAPDIETAAYRIIQEALTNVARHAQVKDVAVRVWADDRILNLQVEDRGVGFDPAAVPIGASGGLAGMRERAALLGGQITIESAPGAGTHLAAAFPI